MQVFVSDVSFTKVGDHWSRSIPELAFDACKGILKDGGISPEAVVVGNALSELSSSQGQLGALIANGLGISGADSFKVEASGASGATAIHVATNLIKSGQCKSVLVLGIEKMRDIEPSKLVFAQSLSENSEYSLFFGISFAGLSALIARMYMKHFDISRERLSTFPVLAHRNSSTVEHAQFKKKFSIDEVSRSELVADPLRVLDCAPVGDGAAAALLVDGSLLSESQRRGGVEILASEGASGDIDLFDRQDILHFGVTHTVTRNALRKSNLSLEDIDFFEIHDAYSIEAALAVEAMGLSKRGSACLDAASGIFDLEGKKPVSTFGGMKARGYPIGAAGVYQLCEAFLQLSDRAGRNQVRNARRGLIHAMSGLDGSAYVHVLARSGGH